MRLAEILMILNFSINMQRYIAGVQTGVLDMVRTSSVSPTHLLPRACALGKLTDLWWQKTKWPFVPGWHCVGRVLDQRPEAGHQEEDPGGGDPPQLRRRDLEERLGGGHPESPCLSYLWQSYTNLNKVAKRDSNNQLKIRNFQYFSIWQCGWVWIYDFETTFGLNN